MTLLRVISMARRLRMGIPVFFVELDKVIEQLTLLVWESPVKVKSLSIKIESEFETLQKLESLPRFRISCQEPS